VLAKEESDKGPGARHMSAEHKESSLIYGIFSFFHLQKIVGEREIQRLKKERNNLDIHP
jgi:hypothetical protein